MSANQGKGQYDIAACNFNKGFDQLHQHPIFSTMLRYTRLVREEGNLCPKDGWVVVSSNGFLHPHPTRRGEPEEWIYVMAHALLHLGLGHLEARDNFKTPGNRWVATCDLFVAKFLADLKLGKAPLELDHPIDFMAGTEEQLFKEFNTNGMPSSLWGFGTAGSSHPDMVLGEKPAARSKANWPRLFGIGLGQAVKKAVSVSAGYEVSLYGDTHPTSEAMKARNWFLSSYPLLGSLASCFRIIEDSALCRSNEITVAAINCSLQEIYINPSSGLSASEYRFVIAHELMHAGLCHENRRQGRDPYLWNVACDYVINSWLIEMDIGDFPLIGGLYDPGLKGLSAESIYDRLVTDIRRLRKLATLRGVGLGDMLGSTKGCQKADCVIDLDEFYRSALMQGLTYHKEGGRGLLPAGLEEAIKALSQPPIHWEVELAQWFDQFFPPLEKQRTYSRLSRRQSATPDIPRPLIVPVHDGMDGRTFGVILDTSGSMNRLLLAKSLGAIASYCFSRDVPLVRVIFCDAVVYDQGYLSPEYIADRVHVKGRGGTVLQPAIDWLENAEDFPENGPLLVITDGCCDNLRIKREHAFLMPMGSRLPFIPRGPIFRIR